MSGYGYKWVEIILIYIIYYIIYINSCIYCFPAVSLDGGEVCVICHLSAVTGGSIENSLYFSSILCFSTCSSKNRQNPLFFHFLSSYFCRVPAGSRGRHTDKERFEDIILYWNLDNSFAQGNKQKTLTLMLYACSMWSSLYIVWRGLLFIIGQRQSRASVQ